MEYTEYIEPGYMQDPLPERYFYDYQIRMANYDNHVPDEGRFVASDVLEAMQHAFPETKHIKNVDAMLAMFNENEKEVICVPTPYGDIPMWCISNSAWIDLHIMENISFKDYGHYPVRPDVEIVHRTVQRCDQVIRKGMPFFEALLLHYSHEIRVAYAEGTFGEFYVAEDVCNALGFDNKTSELALSAVDDSMKRLLIIEAPMHDKEMWCVHGDALDTLMEPSGTTFSDHLWMTVLPSREIIHDVRKGKSREISTAEYIYYTEKELRKSNPVNSPKFAEKEIELALESKLIAQNIDVQRQVHCEAGIADVVTPNAIYEIKDELSKGKLREAIAQVIAYRACINPKAIAIVVGRKHGKYNPDTKYAKMLGVKVMIWED